MAHPFKPQFDWFESLRLSTQIFQLCRGGSSWVDPKLNKDLLMGLAQGHKAVTRVMFEPATPSVSSQAL